MELEKNRITRASNFQIIPIEDEKVYYYFREHTRQSSFEQLPFFFLFSLFFPIKDGRGLEIRESRSSIQLFVKWQLRIVIRKVHQR